AAVGAQEGGEGADAGVLVGDPVERRVEQFQCAPGAVAHRVGGPGGGQWWSGHGHDGTAGPGARGSVRRGRYGRCDVGGCGEAGAIPASVVSGTGEGGSGDVLATLW